MGVDCSSIIEFRGPDGWRVFPEETEEAAHYECTFGPVLIPRVYELYKILGWLKDSGEEVAMPHSEGTPPDMSCELDKHVYDWEDCDARERMRYMSLDQLRAASEVWERKLEIYDEAVSTSKLTLRHRLAAAEFASAMHESAEVRMVYWFS